MNRPTSRDLAEIRESVVVAQLQDMGDMLHGRGAHEDHEQRQVRRCVYCSCGLRVQGELPKRSK